MPDAVELFKALADETRLSILQMLLDGEMCVCEIMESLPLSQPAVSHHLRILRQAGLVKDRREGKWTYYDIIPAGLEAARDVVDRDLLTPLQHRWDCADTRNIWSA